ncbi:MAG: MBL fold metallo-hydrolase [Myxococcales bacterium]|jgi:ribonuclease BN (tRNA processing enzyme)
MFTGFAAACLALVLAGCASAAAGGQPGGGGAPSGGGRCGDAPRAVQVLGSGGPIPDDDRASAAYLIWIDGRARALIDAGGGLLPRFGASGARIEDLDVVALTHLHADHAAGLPALLKGGYFTSRQRELPVLGPSGGDDYPDVAAFLQAIFDPGQGAFRYLSGYLDGSGLFPLRPKVIDAALAGARPRRVFEGTRLAIDACPVKHGPVPALGFVVEVEGTRVAFTGDQSATARECFEQLAAGADLLIAHHAIPEHGAEDLRHLHSTPSELGALAATTGARKLVLSHNMQRALRQLDVGLKAIAARYDGPVVVAEDLRCEPLPQGAPSPARPGAGW